MIITTAHSADRSKHWHLWAGIAFTRIGKEVEAQWNEVPCRGPMVRKPNWNGAVQTLSSADANVWFLRTALTAPGTSSYWNFCFRKFLLGEFTNTLPVRMQLFLRRLFLYWQKGMSVSLGQGSVKCMPWAGAVTHYAATLSPTCVSWFRVWYQGLLGGLVSAGTWGEDGVQHKPLPPVLECRNNVTTLTARSPGPLWQISLEGPWAQCTAHWEGGNSVSFFAPDWLVAHQTVHKPVISGLWLSIHSHFVHWDLHKACLPAMNGALPNPSSPRFFKYRIWTLILSRWNPDPRKKKDLILSPLLPKYKVGDRQRVREEEMFFTSLPPSPLGKAFWC